jgi:hypothetical protein
MKRKSFVFSFAIAAFFFLGGRTAHAQIYDAILTGPAESPPNASPGTGFAEVSVNLATHMLAVHVNFTGLVAGTTASHVHAPTAVPFLGTAGVATQTPTFSGFPLGVTSGTYDNTFDMTLTTTWNPAYVTANGGTAAGAETAFEAALAAGEAYLNIHTTTFPGGEIRGFLLPVPEPDTIALGIAGGLALSFMARRARRSSR